MASDSLTAFERLGSPPVFPVSDPFDDYASQIVHIFNYEHHASKTINRFNAAQPAFNMMKDFDHHLPSQVFTSFDYSSPLFKPSPPPVIPRFVNMSPPPFSLNIASMPDYSIKRPIARVKPTPSIVRESKKPRTRLPASAVNVMQNWFMDHLPWPYPNDDEKKLLAEQTNLSVAQVVNWFTNTRKRFWIPNRDKFVDPEGKVRTDWKTFEDIQSAVSSNSPAYVSSTSDSGDM